MTKLAHLFSLGLLIGSCIASKRPRVPHIPDYDTYTYHVLSARDAEVDALAASLGVQLVDRVGELTDEWLVRHRKTQLSKRYQQRRDSDPRIEPSYRRRRVKRVFDTRQSEEEQRLAAWDAVAEQIHVDDPGVTKQWHLVNLQDPQNTINVTGVWTQSVTGQNVTVCVIDDGLDVSSQDLADNFFAEGSYDFNDNTELPLPRLSDDNHGTRCAGEIAAVRNDVCGVGVAYDANIAGVRILSGDISDADEAAAINYAYQLNDIYSCSWGPADDGRTLEAPSRLVQKALINGANNGRDGKGSIFVFASGNGAGSGDHCNADGYTNSIYSITVSSVSRFRGHPIYAEGCSANMVVTYSSGDGSYIYTTDVGEAKCTGAHGGTSAAAPIAAGVFALVLQVRPDLTWRDLQYLVMLNAIPVNSDDESWELNASGRNFSNRYGYGMLDAYQLVEAARTWTLVKPQAYLIGDDVEMPGNGTAIAQNDTGVSATYEITADHLRKTNFEKLEHFTVKVWIEHEHRGDIEIEMLSPRGTRSVLFSARHRDASKRSMQGWQMMSVKSWGEDPKGIWTLTVYDRTVNEFTGKFIGFNMALWGTAADAKKVHKYEWGAHNDEDEEPAHAPSSTRVISKPTEALSDDHAGAAPMAGTAHRRSLLFWIAATVGMLLTLCAFAGLVYYLVFGRDKQSTSTYTSIPLTERIFGRKKAADGRGQRSKDLYDAFAEFSSGEDSDGPDGQADRSERVHLVRGLESDILPDVPYDEVPLNDVIWEHDKKRSSSES